jgi:hypothetical protein
LIGWVQDVAPVDSGVPREAKRVLVNALVRRYTLLFVGEAVERSSVWRALPDRWVRQAAPSGILSRLFSSGFSIVATMDTLAGEELFESQCLWSLENQLVLLAGRDASPPDLRFDLFEALLKSKSADFRRLPSIGVLGAMMPGPDGDFAQLLLWGGQSMEGFAEHLRAECEAAHISFASVPETEFKKTKWFLEEVKG